MDAVNPYHTLAAEATDRLLALGTDALLAGARRRRMVHVDALSEWRYPSLANGLLLVAARAVESGAPDADAALSYCRRAFEALLEAATEDRWYHGAAGQGDPNIDRFTLVPFLEAFELLRDRLAPSLAESVAAKAAAVLQVQWREYGSGRKGFPDRVYPNMDVYYCLLMLLGHRLTGDERWQRESSRMLDALARAMFPDGGWTYIGGTNECPVYHGLVAALSARIHQLTDDERALAMIRKSVPYYPLVIYPSGRAEYHTDPWWKHTWGEQRAYAPDIVASVTGDGANRWVGDLLRQPTAARLVADLEEGTPDNIFGVMLAYAAWLWRDVEPRPPATEWMVEDRNIDGPRGRFGGWSWAASARYGNDTIVGACTHRAADASTFLALMAVTAEVPHPDQPDGGDGMARTALAMTPEGTHGTTRVHADHCTFNVTYRLANLHAVWGAESFPLNWTCQQSWRLQETTVVGDITLRSEQDQPSPAPLVRVRCGRGLQFEPTGTGVWRYGPYRIEVRTPDFTKAGIRAVAVPVYAVDRDCSELVLRLPRPPTAYERGAMLRASIAITHDV